MFWIANYAVASSPQHAARFENDPFQTVIVGKHVLSQLNSEATGCVC